MVTIERSECVCLSACAQEKISSAVLCGRKSRDCHLVTQGTHSDCRHSLLSSPLSFMIICQVQIIVNCNAAMAAAAALLRLLFPSDAWGRLMMSMSGLNYSVEMVARPERKRLENAVFMLLCVANWSEQCSDPETTAAAATALCINRT